MAECKVTLGGKEFTLSPVPAVGLKHIGPKIKLIGASDSEDAIDALVDGLYFGIKRNHKDVDREFVEWNLDVTNMRDLIEKFVEVNTAGVAPQSGEA